MSGSALLIHLLGGVALLLWATRLVRTGIERAIGERLRKLIGSATATPLSSFATGLGVATALQSSTAAGVLVAGFARRGMVGVAAGIAFMLGADIGSTLIVQLLAFDLSQMVPLLLLIGVVLFMATSAPLPVHIGRVLIGIALMVTALGMIVHASEPLRESWLMAAMLSRLEGDLILALIIGALLCWALHSTVATVLFILSLASAQVIQLPLAAILIIAANVGAGLIPLGLSWKLGTDARRIMLANLALRIAMAALALGVISLVLPIISGISRDPARALALLHTAFNLVQAALALPFLGLIAASAIRLVPTGTEADAVQRPLHLDPALLNQPPIALANASREVLRLADGVEVMLRESLSAFSDGDDKRRDRIRALDDEVDRQEEQIKLYLTRLSRGSLQEEDARRCIDLIMFTTNLEHVGDIIDKGLIALAAKKARGGHTFSDTGWAEIVSLHEQVLAHMRLAMTVFQTRDLDMARQLVARKDQFRTAEANAARAHLERLREGGAATIDTSTLHLDILRDLKRIVSHLTSVAVPILEAAGELRGTRLKGEVVEQ
jgi:phosphate:Na+ symporter